MKAERVVLDTNVLISAALSPHGKPFACLSWVLDNATLLTSQELLTELETRLARPKFSKYVDEPGGGRSSPIWRSARLWWRFAAS